MLSSNLSRVPKSEKDLLLVNHHDLHAVSKLASNGPDGVRTCSSTNNIGIDRSSWYVHISGTAIIWMRDTVNLLVRGCDQ